MKNARLGATESKRMSVRKESPNTNKKITKKAKLNKDIAERDK